MDQYIDASHNMLFTLSKDKWTEDLEKSSKGDIVGYQEAGADDTRQAITRFCTRTNRGLFMPESGSNPISWNREMFRAIGGESGVLRVHRRHPSAKFNPARDITWRGLRYRENGIKVLRINIHPVAGATDLTPEEGPVLTAWEDWALGQYYLDLLGLTAEQMSREFWDVITLGGDYNAAMDRDERWYYPGRLLPALYADDRQMMKGLDHLQHTHGSDVKVDKRWAVQGHTDHRIHFITRTFTPVPDFPGQRA